MGKNPSEDASKLAPEYKTEGRGFLMGVEDNIFTSKFNSRRINA